MDPYELFSTPPNDLVLSSTPQKQRIRAIRRNARPPNSARKAVLNERTIGNPRASISFDSEQSFEKTKISKKRNNQQQLQLNSSVLNKSLSKRNNTKNKKKNQEAENLWDKCLKSNPELAQFVDEFNHSLEEATSKPLDMTGMD